MRDGFATFHNRLRRLLNIDRIELAAAGVIPTEDRDDWMQFRTDPFRFFIRLDDDRARLLWGLITAPETDADDD